MPSTVTAQSHKGTAARELPAETERGKPAFIFYCLFIVSYFLHMGDRVSLLGMMRIDILLSGLALVSILAQKKTPGRRPDLQPASRLLLILSCYVIVTLPLVKWPGSVLGRGWEPFLKAICFYFFTVMTVTSEKRLKWFLAVFIGVQVFRVLEPLYLHVTTGYWGSFTNMGNYEFMDRLSGSPHDIVNPNGLAFIILVAICLLHNLLAHGDRKQKLLYLGLLAPILYAMALTGSRSGMSVLALFALMVVWQSKHRIAALAALSVIVVVLVASMSDLERQRYLSIVDKDAKGAATAQGRVDGLWTDFMVGLERPIFGHGLGTSAEANAHAYGDPKPSHTLYTEVLQELGFVGLIIFLSFVATTCKNCLLAVRLAAAEPGGFLHRASAGLRDFAILLIVFSVASYGLNEYQWYVLAGLSVVLCRILKDRNGGDATSPDVPGKGGRGKFSRGAVGAQRMHTV